MKIYVEIPDGYDGKSSIELSHVIQSTLEDVTECYSNGSSIVKGRIEIDLDSENSSEALIDSVNSVFANKFPELKYTI